MEPDGRASGFGPRGESVRAETAAIARGDERAFARFYEIWFDRSFRLARAITKKDEAFCLDVVQDAMMRVVKSLEPHDDEASLARWMKRVIHTTALDRLRQDLRRARREEVAARSAASLPGASKGADDEATAERIEWIRARLAALPDADRRLLELRYEQGLSLDEVGGAIGSSGDAAHGRIRRLLLRLRAAVRTARSTKRTLLS